jgi:hypothetical protein
MVEELEIPANKKTVSQKAFVPRKQPPPPKEKAQIKVRE